MSLSVSVIIPAFNAEKFLRAAIESVLAQNHLPNEVIVVNDGSIDDTRLIAESFGSRVRCLNQNNCGLSQARNAGIKAAQGNLIALLDADDTWLPEKLKLQVDLLEQQTEAVACFTRTVRINENAAVLSESALPVLENLVEQLLLYSCVIGPPSAALIRREAFERVGLFDPEFSQCADWDMWLRLAEVGKVVYVDKPLVNYLVHQSNMSKNIPLLEKDSFAVIDKFFSKNEHKAFQYLQTRCYSNHWMILSGSYLHAGMLFESLRCGMNGLLAYPQNIKRPLGLPVRWARRLGKVAASIF